MFADGTLLLRRGEVERLLSIKACIDAVENIFRLQGEGKIPAPGILGVKAPNGGLHVKAALLPGAQNTLSPSSTQTSLGTTRRTISRRSKAWWFCMTVATGARSRFSIPST
jgi:ornithine cyclodeaminase/alanine dehydrogenase-like protein (mu-crystallin family)